MVHFNELKYNQNKTCLIIDVAVNDGEWYDDVFINSIAIDNQNTFTANGPSSTPIFTYSVPESQEEKHIVIEVPVSMYSINPQKDMLFVYITTKGNPDSEIPCGCDVRQIMGTVVDLQGIYGNMLQYIKEVGNTCIVPADFIDSILKYKALDLYIKTGNYPMAIKYWNKYIVDSITNISNFKTCRCNG